MSGVLNEPIYRDLPLSFNAHPVTGNITLKKNNDAVAQSVKNVVLTNIYEVPYKPLYGSDTRSQLFENFSSMTEHQLKKNITTAIENYEPRVELISVRTRRVDEQNSLEVTIEFRVINTVEPVSVSVFLNRVR